MNPKVLCRIVFRLATFTAAFALLFSANWDSAAQQLAGQTTEQQTSYLYLPVIFKNFQPAWVNGRVSRSGSGEALEGVNICSQNGECATSDTQGNYRLYLSAGWKQLKAEKAGYVPAVQSLQVPPSETRVADFTLTPSDEFSQASFFGKVVDAQNQQPLSAATVCNHLNDCTTTASDGTYTLNVNALGQFELRAEKEGYLSLSKSATAINNQPVEVNFALSKQWQTTWIEGQVIDASRGREEEKALSGVQLCTQFNECATSDSEGKYRINVSSADWREITAQKAGFYTVAKGIQPIAGQGVTLNFVLSPYLSGMVARIVLTWDATPEFNILGYADPLENDLDAYLYIAHSIGDRVIYFEAGDEYLSSRLLYDVRKGSGPETIDIVQYQPSPKPTRYFYGVHHANYLYSGRQMPTLYQLGAQVCLYTTTNQVARCYTAPPGDLQFWFVFKLDQEGNLVGRECLVDEIPQIDYERPNDPEDKGARVVGISFPTCPSP